MHKGSYTKNMVLTRDLSINTDGNYFNIVSKSTLINLVATYLTNFLYQWGKLFSSPPLQPLSLAIATAISADYAVQLTFDPHMHNTVEQHVVNAVTAECQFVLTES